MGYTFHLVCHEPFDSVLCLLFGSLLHPLTRQASNSAVATALMNHSCASCATWAARQAHFTGWWSNTGFLAIMFLTNVRPSKNSDCISLVSRLQLWISSSRTILKQVTTLVFHIMKLACLLAAIYSDSVSLLLSPVTLRWLSEWVHALRAKGSFWMQNFVLTVHLVNRHHLNSLSQTYRKPRGFTKLIAGHWYFSRALGPSHSPSLPLPHVTICWHTTTTAMCSIY